MSNISLLLNNNKTWAAKVLDKDPDFFNRLSVEQTPKFLWIGCCDSRVPAEQITGLMPGDLFVHRNIANQASPSDTSLQAILQFALGPLKIRHIILAGHYLCGGVQAALAPEPEQADPLSNWLHSLRNTSRHHHRILEPVTDITARADKLSELNVAEQVHHLSRHPTVRQVWQAGEELSIHGVIYDIRTGLLETLGDPVKSSTSKKANQTMPIL